MLEIDDVIKTMKEMKAAHGNIEVCRIGHFGEINEMDKWNITTRKAYPEEDINKERLVVNIEPPDIGPEPD